MAKEMKIAFRRGRYVLDYRRCGIRRRHGFDTRAEAVAVREKLKAQPVIAPAVASVIETGIAESIRQYRDITKAKRIGQTFVNEQYYFGELALWLVNEVGLDFVHQIKSAHLEIYSAKLSASGNAKSTINRKFNAYRAWLNKCVTWGSIAKSPMNADMRLQEDEPNIKTWSESQLDAAMGAVPDWLKDVLCFLDRTGRRPIDAARAKFQDVDETNRTIRVKSYKGSKTKTLVVALSKDAFEMIVNLKEKLKREFRAKPDDFIFLNAKKKPVTTNAIGLALRKAGIRDVTSYGLRHSFANGLVDDGVHARDVQVLMGHAKFETTTRYTRRRVDHLRAAVENRAQKRVSQGRV